MTHWRPTATKKNLAQRAQLYGEIRRFFGARNVLEVETPLLAHYGVTDIHVENITATYRNGHDTTTLYLQTSPEYAMKRLLAAECGAIYQICKAFRHEACGRHHNPEFTMLEWYRPGFTHHLLMDEVDEFLQAMLSCAPAKRASYVDTFQHFLNVDPLTVTLPAAEKVLVDHGIHVNGVLDKDFALQLLMHHLIEPQIGITEPFFIYDFPSSQAALAKLSVDNPLVAHRFEVYFQGLELANGFYELTNSHEQQKRFISDQAARQQLQLEPRQIDPHLIAALQHGLPECAGVALGVDRLLMILTGEKDIQSVMSFSFANA